MVRSDSEKVFIVFFNLLLLLRLQLLLLLLFLLLFLPLLPLPLLLLLPLLLFLLLLLQARLHTLMQQYQDLASTCSEVARERDKAQAEVQLLREELHR